VGEASAAMAAAFTVSGAPDSGWPTSQWRTSWPWAWSSLARWSTSITLNDSTDWARLDDANDDDDDDDDDEYLDPFGMVVCVKAEDWRSGCDCS